MANWVHMKKSGLVYYLKISVVYRIDKLTKKSTYNKCRKSIWWSRSIHALLPENVEEKELPSRERAPIKPHSWHHTWWWETKGLPLRSETRRGGCSLFLLTNKCRHGGPRQSIWQGQEIQRREIEKGKEINTWYDHVFGTTWPFP